MKTRYNDHNDIENLKEKVQANESVLLKGKNMIRLWGKGCN